jgi:hypothetical protein
MSGGSELYLALVLVSFGAFAVTLAAVSLYARGEHRRD